jgi:hypothetical protein
MAVLHVFGLLLIFGSTFGAPVETDFGDDVFLGHEKDFSTSFETGKSFKKQD